MAQISILDFTGSADIHLTEPSMLGNSQLRSLTSSTSELRNCLSDPLISSRFRGATFAASFEKPYIPLPSSTLDVKTSVNSAITVSRASDTPLFGNDDYDSIDIRPNDCWVSFELDTALRAAVTVPIVSGFGVSFGAETAPSFATYKFISSAHAPDTSLKAAIEETLSAFTILNSAEDVLAIEPDLIYTSDLAGAITIGGFWSLPLSVNQLSLADARLPFNTDISVNPEATLALSGKISLQSEFNIRFRRMSAGRLRLGAYKKNGHTFGASFTAAAGIGADAEGVDLIKVLFTALSPGVDLGGLAPDDFAKIRKVLNDSIDRSLAVSLNAACSSAFSDEAAIVYEIDVSDDEATKDAINSALHGDWSAIPQLPQAQKIRNVLIDTLDSKQSITVNLLGLYNYSSFADFVRNMRIVKNDADGSILITDTVSATRVVTASTPLAADPDRLRAALYDAFVATATFKALATGVGATSTMTASQDFLLYEHAMSYRAALKQINAGEALGVVPLDLKRSLSSAGDSVHHARFTASCLYGNEDVLRFFFANIQSLTPRTLIELTKIGRSVLASLLDPQDPTDSKRISVLNDDKKWASLDSNPARIEPPFYSDWYDITMWAGGLANVAPLLADAIKYGKTVAGDPTADRMFMKKREALLRALAGAAHKTHAAFEKAFPICVMATLAGRVYGPHPPDFEVSWNSRIIFSTKPAARVVTGGSS